MLFLIASVYAAIGHGGASGYLAILLIAGFLPEDLRPIVLLLNVMVTGYLLLSNFVSREATNWQMPNDKVLFVWLILAAIPAAFLGGSLQLEESIYRIILGVLLFVSAIRLLTVSQTRSDHALVVPNRLMVVAVGLSLGFLSGLTGIGGGVLLSPFLVLFRWVDIKQSIPIVAGFILLNSLAGLAGWYSQGYPIVTLDNMLFFKIVIAVFFGAVLGRLWSSHWADHNHLRYVLVLVLMIASVKMLLTGLV